MSCGIVVAGVAVCYGVAVEVDRKMLVMFLKKKEKKMYSTTKPQGPAAAAATSPAAAVAVLMVGAASAMTPCGRTIVLALCGIVVETPVKRTL